MSESNKGRLFMLGVALCGGLTGVCVKSVTWGTMSLMASRSLISFLMICAFRRSFRFHLSKANILGAVFSALTGIIYIQAIKLTTAGTAIVLQYIAPILVYLYQVIFKKYKAHLYEALITLAVFGGCALSFADNLDMSHILGNCLAVVSGFTYAGQIICMNRTECDSQDSMLLSNLLCIIFCTPFMFFDSALTFTAANIVWVLILGIVQYGLANIFLTCGIQRVSSIEGSLILTIEPIFNPIPVAIFCGEMMGVRAILGSVIVIVFVTLYGLIPKLAAKKNAGLLADTVRPETKMDRKQAL